MWSLGAESCRTSGWTMLGIVWPKRVAQAFCSRELSIMMHVRGQFGNFSKQNDGDKICLWTQRELFFCDGR